jgi:hypothetical protein
MPSLMFLAYIIVCENVHRSVVEEVKQEKSSRMEKNGFGDSAGTFRMANRGLKCLTQNHKIVQSYDWFGGHS